MIALETYIDTLKADLSTGVITVNLKTKAENLLEPERDKLAQYVRADMLLELTIQPRGKETTVSIGGKLVSIKADCVADIINLSLRIMRSDLTATDERVLAQACGLHINTYIEFSAAQGMLFDSAVTVLTKVRSGYERNLEESGAERPAALD